MTSLSYEQAADDMKSIIDSAWGTTGFNIQYDNIKSSGKPSNKSPYARMSIIHSDSRQDSLGGLGNRSFLRLGTIIVGLFVPVGNGLSQAYQLAKLVSDAYEGITSENGVWFRDIRINEIGPDGSFFQVAVNIDFEYYEQK